MVDESYIVENSFTVTGGETLDGKVDSKNASVVVKGELVNAVDVASVFGLAAAAAAATIGVIIVVAVVVIVDIVVPKASNHCAKNNAIGAKVKSSVSSAQCVRNLPKCALKTSEKRA